jgi:RNA polymerase sigma-70 factor (ECF subfamily)
VFPSAFGLACSGVVTDEDTAALVVRAQRGEPAAFDELVRRFLRAAYSVALAVLVRRADAEDVAQEAMVVALEQVRTCQNPRAFKGWLLQIVRNRALNAADKRRVREVHVVLDRAEPVVEETRPQLAGQRERLLAALATIPPTQREIVLLHDLEDWTHGEIAEILEISEVMSRQHLFQARRALRDVLAGDEPWTDDEK